MIITQRKAVVSATAQSNTKRKYHKNILADVRDLVKKKYNKFSIWFWRLNYGLEMKRQDHCAEGNLFREIGACLILLVYRAAGRIAK